MNQDDYLNNFVKHIIEYYGKKVTGIVSMVADLGVMLDSSSEKNKTSIDIKEWVIHMYHNDIVPVIDELSNNEKEKLSNLLWGWIILGAPGNTLLKEAYNYTSNNNQMNK